MIGRCGITKFVTTCTGVWILSMSGMNAKKYNIKYHEITKALIFVEISINHHKLKNKLGVKNKNIYPFQRVYKHNRRIDSIIVTFKK
jgi:hypothetical protein